MRLYPGWTLKPLDAVVDILDSRRVPVKATERAARGGTVPYYGATGIAGTIDRALFDEPLVLLGEDGAPFFDHNKPKAFLIDGPAWVNNHAHVVRPRREMDRRFLKYYLDAFNYRGFANGTTRLKLTQGAMRSIPVPTPDLPEQRRVVEILEDHLTRLDGAEVALGNARTRIKAMRASALHRRVVGPAVRLGEVAIARGYGTSTKCVRNGPGVPVARIPNMVRGRLDMSDEKRAANPDVDLDQLLLRRGDLLIVRTNGSRDLIGRAALIEQDAEVAFASYLIRYRLDSTRISPAWALAALEAPLVREELEAAAASSAGQHNLSIAKLDAIQLPCPDLKYQSEALAGLKDLDDAALRLENAIFSHATRSSSLRRAVLVAAFEGKLTGRPADIKAIEELAYA